MVVENDAHIQSVPRVLKVVPLSVRVMEGGKDVHSKVVGFVQRVCMEEPTFV